MCGIAGSINYALDIPTLTKTMYHRGPDEQTTYRKGNVELHHHRLAIVDVAGGGQPMHYQQFTIIFNGEIYNHQEIRTRHQLQCQTSSDTETILHAYARLGKECFQEFDGMFALCILDTEKRELLFVRDRAGKKPLYYYKDDGHLIFASELNAINTQVKLSINEEHLRQYVRMGYFYKEATPYKNVWELPAGSIATISLDTVEVKLQKWWDIAAIYKKQGEENFDQALETVDGMLHQAVKRRVESSDLEVGSFLSGGIDSGIVSAIATQYNNKLKTFTVSFEGEYDESPLARLVSERYGTNHHEIRISFDSLATDIEKILSNYGEPFFDSSAIPSYYVSREARKHLTVILNGDGGDELFGGYRRYVPFAKFDFFNSGFIVKNPARLMHNIMPVANNKKSKYNYIYRLIDFARKDGLAAYLSATIDSFEGYENRLVTSLNYLRKVQIDFEKVNQSGESGLKKIMHLDFDSILAGDLLVKMDIATMAHSLEGRSPLLSRELLEYVPSLPDKFKIQRGQTKFLLRKLAERYLPAELINQPKRGFEIPLKKWIDGLLKEMIADYILSPQAYCRQFVQPGFIEDIWNRKLDCGEEKRAKMIWTLFALEVWYRKCYLK
ncbi:asparagine synthase (glutamine-hydrolyzing) [Terrimonas sp. NA20]|uniref:asparagine synthase (glutamine-hydrolyzing) n=1 Tax=Terrimonas ginsenosidimutans TaxID=2908004 RepID=A0ABS9KNS3_9BACT|nr:asparagine synthase (glutamine-hydrolyzing) [Terrimonas ginsenosidimutans]MCG2613985.1 asparagine synthase (glutamine-hydrolyzing) [Terrimonas ginsenosidimutans]